MSVPYVCRCQLAVLCNTGCWLKGRTYSAEQPLRQKAGCTVFEPTEYKAEQAIKQTQETPGQCHFEPRTELRGGDLSTVKVHSQEECCEECAKEKQCAAAAFCGGDTCFMKDRTAGPEVYNPQCTNVIARPELVNDPWLPNDPDVEKVIEAMPDNQKSTHKHGAWELLKKRIRHNDHMWSKMNVTFPSQRPKEAVRILLLASPYAQYGMDWHTGEHLQWGDIIYTLVRLGHKVYVAGKYNWKQWKADHSQWDMIVTDYGGVSQLWKSRTKISAAKNPSNDLHSNEALLTALRCKLRIVDTFGTSEEFNKDGRKGVSKKMVPALGIRLDQYWSYYPQVGPRSTFVGFTITDHDFGSTAATNPAPQRTWKAVLWGKHPSYMGLERNKEWLRAISNEIDIVATIDSEALESGDFADTLPDFIDNRGILDPLEYFALLRSSALLIGVGQPFWGNAALDALQQGVMTLLPTFHPPLGHCEDCIQHFPGQDAETAEAKSLKGRFENMPNRFPLTSQNPYIENVGEPDVYSLSLSAHKRNASQVQHTLARARAQFERRSATGKAFPSRLPPIWEPQAFVNRLSKIMQRHGLCAGRRITAISMFVLYLYACVVTPNSSIVVAGGAGGYRPEATDLTCFRDEGDCNSEP